MEKIFMLKALNNKGVRRPRRLRLLIPRVVVVGDKCCRWKDFCPPATFCCSTCDWFKPDGPVRFR